jgi:hypothetical protein
VRIRAMGGIGHRHPHPSVLVAKSHLGSVRRALSNERPYRVRDFRCTGCLGTGSHHASLGAVTASSGPGTWH